MPRKPRFYLPGVPVHVVQRGNNRQAVFFDESDYLGYLGWLKEAAHRYGCAIHAYVLMTNHVHMLLTPESAQAVGRLLQYVGRYYVQYVNREYRRSGTLWEGRHKGSLIHSEAYLLTCQRYIEMNPVRAGMVRGPGEYRWSSYRANALGAKDEVVTPHPLYRALGRSATDRHARYQELFRALVDPASINAIRAAWQTGTPLGDEHFREEVEAALDRKVGHARRGRPRWGTNP